MAMAGGPRGVRPRPTIGTIDPPRSASLATSPLLAQNSLSPEVREELVMEAETETEIKTETKTETETKSKTEKETET